MTPTLLSNPAANLSLLVMIAKATIILVAALGITLAMQRASAGARHLVWLVALAALLLVPVLTAWAPLPLRILPAAEPTTWSVVTPSTPALPVVAELPSTTPSRATAATMVAPVTAPATASRPWIAIDGLRGLELLAAVWLVVALAIVASLAWSGLTVRRIVHQAHPLVSTGWLTPLWEVSDRLGLEEAPRLLRSDEAKMPFACGLLQPTIVLPVDCESWTTDRRQAVLLHELAHVRRHDLLGHTLARLVCAAYWFHPLAWTAAKQLRSESERACDDLALSCGTRATDYAEHLLEIVTSVRGDATPAVALAMARRKEFEGRMLAILDAELPHSSPSRRQSATLIGTLALVALTVGAVSPKARVASAARPELRAPYDTGFDRDSRLLGPERTDTDVATRTDTRIARRLEERTHTDERVVEHQVSSAVSETTDAAVNSVVNSVLAAVNPKAIGDAAASAVVSALGTRGVQQRSDDRPALLAKILRTDTSETIRQTAAWGLREFADNQVAAEALANAVMHDKEACVREMAAWALAEADGRSDAITALSTALHADINANVRRTAAWSLGQIGNDDAVPALVAALSDEYPEVRQRAAWAIGKVEPKTAPAPLVAMLRDKAPRVRMLAAWALFRIEDPSAAPALEAALKTETDREVQVADLRALAALGEKSVDAIRGLIESPDPAIRSMAVRALAGGRATGPWPWPWPEPRPTPRE